MGQSIGEKSGRLRHARFRAEDTGGKVFLGCEKIEKEITLLESLVLRFFFFLCASRTWTVKWNGVAIPAIAGHRDREAKED